MANDDVKDALETMATNSEAGSTPVISIDVALEAIQAVLEGDILTASEASQAALEAIQAAEEAVQAVVEADRRPTGLMQFRSTVRVR